MSIKDDRFSEECFSILSPPPPPSLPSVRLPPPPPPPAVAPVKESGVDCKKISPAGLGGLNNQSKVVMDPAQSLCEAVRRSLNFDPGMAGNTFYGKVCTRYCLIIFKLRPFLDSVQ